MDKNCALTDIIFILHVSPVHHLEQLHLDLGLVEERLLVLDYLYCHLTLLVVVERLYYLAEAALAWKGIRVR